MFIIVCNALFISNTRLHQAMTSALTASFNSLDSVISEYETKATTN